MSDNKLSNALAACTPGTPALMTHVVLGYPTLAESIDIVLEMSRSGAAFIELQIPFSDPMADGPSIMRANEVALAQGVTPERCMEAMAFLSAQVATPLIFMSYCNILFKYKGKGLEQFCREAAAAGTAALIVPDVPREETQEGYWTMTKEYHLPPISLVSPLSDEARLKILCEGAEGFIYCVATTGTTGARNEIASRLPAYLNRVRAVTTLPLAVGFGISTPEQVASLAGIADIAIVGSAMIDCIRESSEATRLKNVASFTRALSLQS